MIAENKQEFFEQLQRELQKLGVEDTNELMSDLEGHFEEAERRGVPESETCRELGNIAEIARSCLDLKSTAINSMVARDVVRKKGVSLTKPGRSVPADPSLAAPQSGEADGGEDCVRSYTPEHISEEIYPNAAQNGTDNGSSGSASDPNAVGGSDSGSIGDTSDPNTNDGTGNPNAGGGTFEKVGKAVDKVCDKAGKALNDALNKAGNAVNSAMNKGAGAAQAFRPSDSYRENINNKNGGDIPPQYTKVKTKGGGKFIDTSGMQPNPNAGRLVGEIVLDVLLWSWLIIVVFAGVIAVFAATVALVFVGISSLRGVQDFAQFKFITRILFALGFWNLSAAVGCLAGVLAKQAGAFVGYVIKRHIKAVYDIK